MMTTVLILRIAGAHAQDIIYTSIGGSIKAKVLEVDDQTVKYRLFDMPDGPIYSIPKTQVLVIAYPNGHNDTFQQSESAPADNTAKQNTVTKTAPCRTGLAGLTRVYERGFDFGLRIGVLSHYNDAVQEIYGGMGAYGADLRFYGNRGLGFGIGLSYSSKKGNPYTYEMGIDIEDAESRLSVLATHYQLMYRIVSKSQNGKLKLSSYFGAGIQANAIKEDVSVTFWNPYDNTSMSESASVEAAAVGGRLTAGIQISIVFIETSISFLKMKVEGIDEGIQMGGFELTTGVRF